MSKLAEHATGACWTCRRRRVKCDQVVPTCHKCTNAGRICLGYNEKPLRWTNSIASRGKLMGKTTPSIKTPGPSIARCLVDPGLQDLSPAKRGYIKYFDLYCCAESTLFDTTPTNPFKEFMRLIPSSPGLLNTIISIAALHRAQRANTLHISSQINSDTGNKTDLQSQITTPQPSKPFYDALLHKQEALCHIRNEFQNPNVANHDGAIAAVLMFIWLELMDSGRDSWRYHLTALRNIMQKSLFPVLENAKSFMSTFSSSCEYFEMTYAIFDIIGSTFVKPMQPSHAYQPLFTKMSTIDILQLAESQTWIGCPAELLYIISLAKTVPQTAEQGKSLKTHLTSHLTSFSPRRWAIAGPDIARLMPRYHFACAYRDAVSIYISQVTFGWVGCEWEVDSSDGGLEVDLDATIMHLKEISPHDAFYKALVWPAFVIGADAKLEKQRVAIREVLGRLWIVWRAGNVSNALRVLREIWMRGDEELWSKPWIGFLYEWGADWMFV